MPTTRRRPPPPPLPPPPKKVLEGVGIMRVGITKDPARRKKEWQATYPNLRRWKVHGPYRNKSIAQRIESAYARKFNCNAHPGGRGDEHGQWYVYIFYY